MKSIFTLTAAACLAGGLAAQDFPRWTLQGSGGFTAAPGRTGEAVNTGWNLGAGGGYNFSRHLGLNLDYQFHRFGFNEGAVSSLRGIDGALRVSNFSLNPVWRIAPGRKAGAYLTGGYGVYTLTAAFEGTATSAGRSCNPAFGGCLPGFAAGGSLGDITTTRGGFNAGAGFEFRVRETRTKLFTEARYHRIFTTGKSLEMVPVSFGVRW
jgi:opacity protein-like surface antigen